MSGGKPVITVSSEEWGEEEGGYRVCDGNNAGSHSGSLNGRGGNGRDSIAEAIYGRWKISHDVCALSLGENIKFSNVHLVSLVHFFFILSWTKRTVSMPY